MITGSSNPEKATRGCMAALWQNLIIFFCHDITGSSNPEKAVKGCMAALAGFNIYLL